MGNHRADRRAPGRTRTTSTSAVAGGHRRTAPKPTSLTRRPRRSLLSRLPLAPTAAGSMAIAVAAVGAVTAGAEGASAVDLSTATPGLSVRAAAAAVEPAVDDRTVAISRDSAREARRDAASTKLVHATEIQAKQRNALIANFARSAEKQAAKIKENLWVLPMPAGVYHLTATFGSGGGLWSNGHTGLDFAGPYGTPLHAVANGTVTEVGYAGAYGQRTIITLEDGTELWYCHQSAVAVSVGDVVRGGQVIGSLGNTGNTTGPHLHLEVRPGGGDPVDPATALSVHGLQP